MKYISCFHYIAQMDKPRVEYDEGTALVTRTAVDVLAAWVTTRALGWLDCRRLCASLDRCNDTIDGQDASSVSGLERRL